MAESRCCRSVDRARGDPAERLTGKRKVERALAWVEVRYRGIRINTSTPFTMTGSE